MTTLSKTNVDRGRDRSRRWSTFLLPAVLAVVMTGCDLEVFSPAMVDEVSLDDYNAAQALWSGIQGQVSPLMAGQVGPGGFIAFGAYRTDEKVASGHPGQFPDLWTYSDGAPIDENSDAVENLWNQAMKTRYVADFGVDRARVIYERFADSPRPAERERVTRDRIRVHAWAGIAFRILGDNLCHAVVDGSPAEPHTLFYEKGLEALDDGIAFAEEANVADVDETGVRAVYAARAQTRMMMGDWTGAVEDAGRVETSFNGLQTVHSGTEPGDRQRNYVRWINFTADKAGTLWGTPFYEWGHDERQRRSGDMRLPFGDYTNHSTHFVGEDGRRPWMRQQKQLDVNSGWRLATGREMRLIEAEGRLRAGDWQGAIEKINELREWWNADAGGRFERDGHALPMVEADGPNEAWELLMRERGIEGYLEGRRLPDIRRWAVDPGFVPTEVVREATVGDPENDPRRNVLDIDGEFCLPIGRTERRLNPNL